MTKQLREVESNGVICKWVPDEYSGRRAQILGAAGLRCATDDEKLDHADAFKQLREQPYVVDAVLALLRSELDRAANCRALTMWEGTTTQSEILAEAIRPLVLDSTPTEELVAELVKRGARREASCMVTRSTPASEKSFSIGALSMVTTGPVLILPDGAK